MCKKFSLILSNNIQNIEKDKNLLFIRPYNSSKIENYSELIFFPEDNKQNLISKYDYCEEIYKKLINDCRVELNKLHNKDNSYKYWEIIIGQWLKDFIFITYKNYLQLIFIKKNYHINEIWYNNFEKYNFTVNDTESFQWITFDSSWQYSFLSKLAHFINFDCEKKINDPIQLSFYNLNKETKKFKFTDIVNPIFKLFLIINNYIKKDNVILITKTGLPFWIEKLLEIKFIQLPTKFEEPVINYKNKNKILRSKLNFRDEAVEDPFEKFLRANISDFLPISFIENFSSIEYLSKKINLPKKPKFIFTSFSYAYDEIFKVYTAEKTETKIPYLVGQHGNNYFTKIRCNYVPELNFSDRFISWGTQKDSNIFGAFNFKTLKKKGSFKSNGKLIIILDYLNQSNLDLLNGEQKVDNYLREFAIQLNNLDKKIKNNSIIRLNPSFYKDGFGVNYTKIFENLNIEIDNGDKDISSLIKDARLCLFNYDSTGVLENFITNLPTIFLCEKTFINSINTNFEKKYISLFNNNIMFTDPKKLAIHLENNWNKIEDWWFNKDTQIVIQQFNNNFNLKPDKNFLQKIKKILEESYI